MFPSEIIVVPVVFGVTASVLITRMRLKHAERMASLQRPAVRTAEDDARLARLEAAVDSIAVEVERIGEGQRFLTRLLSERPAAVLAEPKPSGKRIDTPH